MFLIPQVYYLRGHFRGSSTLYKNNEIGNNRGADYQSEITGYTFQSSFVAQIHVTLHNIYVM